MSRALDFTKLHVYGPGVGSMVLVGRPTSFAVDASDVGCRSLDVDIVGPDGSIVASDIVDDPTGTKPPAVNYTPLLCGPHKAKIFVDGQLALDG